ncbi:MAG: ergothioneine biosynthesis protein EgtB [Balneolia bacterium]|nr:ergothioneine biosynthesis protein EgtB [Balneolia bacterium]
MSHLKSRYHQVRQRSEKLCEPLTIEDYLPQPADFGSPPKWNLAHVSWFFEELVLKPYQKGYKPFNDDFGFLFNSYYNTLGDRTLRTSRGDLTRPGVDEVYRYRRYVDEKMDELLSGELTDEEKDTIILGLNHEQQHQELMITDMKYMFSLNPLHPVYEKSFNLLAGKNKESGWVDIKEGVYEIGHTGDGFCYDNELGRHKTYLHDAQISKALVTNGEFLEFIEAGGYENFKYWLDEGWSWVSANGVKHPLYWKNLDGSWHQFTLAGLKKLDPDAILGHINFYEADAFARWKGMRLPTEFEWEAAADKFDWGERWEWTNSAYLPYPGFTTVEGPAGEYNGKFMVNQMVLRGASVATSEGHARKTYRNFFHPPLQWQYSGVRLARSI